MHCTWLCRLEIPRYLILPTHPALYTTPMPKLSVTPAPCTHPVSAGMLAPPVVRLCLGQEGPPLRAAPPGEHGGREAPPPEEQARGGQRRPRERQHGVVFVLSHPPILRLVRRLFLVVLVGLDPRHRRRGRRRWGRGPRLRNRQVCGIMRRCGAEIVVVRGSCRLTRRWGCDGFGVDGAVAAGARRG